MHRLYRKFIGNTKGMSGMSISLSVLTDECDEWINLITSRKYGYLYSAEVTVGKHPAVIKPDTINVVLVLNKTQEYDLDSYDVVVASHGIAANTITFETCDLCYDSFRFAVTDEISIDYECELIAPLLTCCAICIRIEILENTLKYNRLLAIGHALSEFKQKMHIKDHKIVLPSHDFEYRNRKRTDTILSMILSNQLPAVD